MAERFDAFVMVNDIRAKEYEVNATKVGEDITTSCFIEAEEDKTFSVWLQSIPSMKVYQTRSALYIDGKYVKCLAQCGENPQRDSYNSFKGYKTTCTETKDYLRAFTFGKLSTTSDVSEDLLSAKAIDQICTIRLDIQMLPLIGPMNHSRFPVGTISTPAVTRAHEDSKAAMLGISVKPGEMLQEPARGQCLCRVGLMPIRRFSITFRYAPRSYLIARGHKLAIGEEVATVPLIGVDKVLKPEVKKRRERQESTLDSSDEDIKAGVAVKSESHALNDRKRPRITMDLTADGDEYRVIEPIRDTIVISDDEDDEDEWTLR